MLSIENKHLIKMHALEVMPNECNGLIIEQNHKYIIFPCKNLSYNPQNHAILSPLDYLEASKLGKIIACYHSQKHDGPSFIDINTSINYNLYSIIYCWDNNKFYVIEPKLKEYLFKDFQIGVNDCFSLVRNFYSAELKINIGDYYRDERWFETNPAIINENFKKEGFIEIYNLPYKENDIILFGNDKGISHLGIFLKNDLFLHHPRDNKSCIEYLNIHYKNRIVKILRHHNYE